MPRRTRASTKAVATKEIVTSPVAERNPGNLHQVRMLATLLAYTFAYFSKFYPFQTAAKYWDPSTQGCHQSYDAGIIEEVFATEICHAENSNRRIVTLEFSQYLENYLWTNYVAGESSRAHALSIVVMMNEKTRERISGWHIFESSNQSHFSGFFHQIMEICLQESPEMTSQYFKEMTWILMFLNSCFNSMEIELCREQVKRLVSLTMWSCLQPSKLIHMVIP